MSYGLSFVLNSPFFQQKLKSLVLMVQTLSSCMEERKDTQSEAEVRVKVPSGLMFCSVLFSLLIYVTF